MGRICGFDERTEREQPSGRGALGGMTCLALGAAAMYFLDPDRGSRRRALIRDKLVGGFYRAGEDFRRTADYTGDRLRGMAAETAAAVSEDDADDRVVCERVRAAMGRAVSHAGAVEVSARDGVVTLVGHVLADEVGGLLRTLSRVRGVQVVHDRLEHHASAKHVPALQGEGRQTQRSAAASDNRVPATRLWGGVSGGMWLLWGLRRGGFIGLASTLNGARLLARSLTSLSPDRPDSNAQHHRPALAPVDQRLADSGLSPNELDQTDESKKAADITSGNTR